jgi:hypothetical protein
VVGQADAQRRDLHARDERAKCALQERVVEQRLEQPGDELDDLRSTGSLALASSADGADAIARPTAAGREPSKRLAQQLVEPKQRLLERRRCAALRRRCAPGASAGREGGALRRRAAPDASCGMLPSRPLSGPGARARDRTTERRRRRQHDRAVDARLARLAPRGATIAAAHAFFKQPGGDARRGAQEIARWICDVRTRTRRPRARSRRRAAGTDSIPPLTWPEPDQRRRERLQLAQLPLGGAVDQLHRARDLDVDLDARLVHQLELPAPRAAPPAHVRAARRARRRPAGAATRRSLSRRARCSFCSVATMSA